MRRESLGESTQYELLDQHIDARLNSNRRSVKIANIVIFKSG